MYTCVHTSIRSLLVHANQGWDNISRGPARRSKVDDFWSPTMTFLTHPRFLFKSEDGNTNVRPEPVKLKNTLAVEGVYSMRWVMWRVCHTHTSCA